MSAELLVEVKAMMDEYVTGVEDAAAQTEEFSGRAGQAWAAVNDHIGEITAATAAAGAALEGYAQSQASTNEIIEQTAIVTGESSESLRGMLDDLTNSTNSAADMAEGMKELVRQGVDTREEMAAILPHMDNFAAATGQTIPDAIDTTRGVLGPLGKDMADAGEEVDAMTHLLRTTDTDLGALRRNLAQVPDELQAMEFGTEDVAAGIEVMIERGFDGEEGVREFRRAVANSKGDFDVLLESLGVTAEEFAAYKAEVAESEGITQAFADANANTLTPMQQALQWVQNLGVEYGGFASTAADLAPALLAVGPAIKGVQLAMSLALGPVGLITAAVAGAAAIAYTLYQNWDEVSMLVTGIWESVKIRAEEIWAAITGTVEQSIEDVVTFFTDMKDDTVELVADMKRAIIEQFTGLLDGAIDSVRGMYEGVTGWFGDMKETIVGNSIIPDMVRDVLVQFDVMRDGSSERTRVMNKNVLEHMRGLADDAMVLGEELGIGWLQSIADTVTGTIDGIRDMVRRGTDLFNSLREIGVTIGSIFAGDWTGIMSVMSSGTVSIVTSMVSEVSSAFSGLVSFISEAAGSIFGTFDSIISSANSVISAVSSALNFAGGLGGAGAGVGIGTALGGGSTEAALGSVAGAAIGHAIAPGVGGAVGGALGGVVGDALDSIIGGGLGGGDPSDVTPEVLAMKRENMAFIQTHGGGKDANITLPHPGVGFAMGGIVTEPTLAMIGEARQREAVIPLDRLPDLVGEMTGGGQMTVTINQTITGVTADDVERQTRRALQRVAHEWVTL